MDQGYWKFDDLRNLAKVVEEYVEFYSKTVQSFNQSEDVEKTMKDFIEKFNKKMMDVFNKSKINFVVSYSMTEYFVKFK